MGQIKKNAPAQDRTVIRKRDWILAAVLLLAAGILFIIFKTQQHGAGAVVQVRVDGETAASYRLSEPGAYPIRTKYGMNLLRIEDGKAYMEEADCPGQDCIRQGKVSRSGEMIVCLPHRLVVEVTAADESSPADPDADGGFDTVAK